MGAIWAPLISVPKGIEMFGCASTLSDKSVCVLVGVEYLLLTSEMLGTKRSD